MSTTTPENPAAPAPDQNEIDPHVYERRWAILAVLCTSLMIVIIGNTSLNVAIPRLQLDLDASNSQLAWMVDSYALVFAGLLFTAGTLGDKFGRKGALQGGLVVFLVGAYLAATASSAGGIIGARAVMGVAAAFVMPSTLSILTNVFPAHERPKAIAIWAGISGGGAAIGPIASGYLLEHFWWGSVFLVNLPIILIALVVGAILVPTSKDPEDQPLDFIGALLSIVALSTLVYGIIEGPHNGWLSGTSFLIFGVAAVALVLFVIWENTTASPMLDLTLFRDRRFSVASAGISLTFFAMFGTFFLVAQYFQLVLGYSALESGLFQLPMAFVMMALAPQVPKLVERFGAHGVVPVGLAFTSLGLIAFSFMTVDSPVWTIYFSVIPLASGMALTMTPLTTLIMASVPLGRAGMGSAMNDTTRELGGALGVAVLGSVLTTTYTGQLAPLVERLPAEAAGYVDSGLGGAIGVATAMGPDGEALLQAAKQAFVDGMSNAAIVGAIAVAVASVAARRLLPRGADVPPGAHPGFAGSPEEGAAGDVVDEGVVTPTPIIE
ncbi:MAG: DHA2 family efflux MFS transporter permease subunit [Acidimicrobiales bacterium]|nr:DHA2 family efflux MFS transporter permease subunit [Acidimicrobiales bacterium]